MDSTLWYGDTSLTGRTLHDLLGPRPLYLLVQTLTTERVETWKNSGFFVRLRTQLTCDVWRKWNIWCETGDERNGITDALFDLCGYPYLSSCLNLFNTPPNPRCVSYSSNNGCPDISGFYLFIDTSVAVVLLSCSLQHAICPRNATLVHERSTRDMCGILEFSLITNC